jgi:hypothetical protein
MSEHIGTGKPDDDEESRRKRAASGAWRLWRWGDRASSANDWGQWLLALLKTKAGATLTAGTVGGAAVVGTIAAFEPDMLRGWLLPPKPAVEVKTERWGSDTIVFPIDGVDSAGRRASFDFIVLPKRYAWAKGSADQLTRDGAVMTAAEIGDSVFQPEIRSGLARSKDLIAVGTASEEGAVAGETGRAGLRARNSARWIASAATPDTRIWLLNLGQFQTACVASAVSADTSWQRPVLLIGVRKQEKDVILSEALADAMAGKSNLPSTECYSSFALSRFE